MGAHKGAGPQGLEGQGGTLTAGAGTEPCGGRLPRRAMTAGNTAADPRGVERRSFSAENKAHTS